MAFANGSNDAYSQMIEVEPTIWAIPGVAYHYLRADQRYFERTGRRFRSTEGFRPIGDPSDYDNGRGNTQWYYWVRKQRKPSSPAGVYPGGSIHGWGRAFDIDLGQDGLDYDQMRAFLEDEGFKFDIDGEPWHCNYYEADMWTVYSIAGLGITRYKSPEELEEEEMATAKEDIVNSIKYYLADAVNQISAALQASLDRLLDAERRESRPRLYQINEPGNDRHSLAAAIDIDEGYVRLFGSPEELDKAKAQQDVAPETPFPLSAADFDAKVAAANAVKAAK